MKKSIYSFTLLGSLLASTINTSYAEMILKDDPHEDDDVVFVGTPQFGNVACNASDSEETTRYVDYILQNNLPTPVTLFNVQLIAQNGDTSGVTADFFVPNGGPDTDPPSCLLSYSSINGGSGSIQGYNTVDESGPFCTLRLNVTPPDCPDTTGPLGGTIDQVLYIGVASQQGELIQDINAEVNVIGAGGQFAVLGGFYPFVDALIPPAKKTNDKVFFPPINAEGYGNSFIYGNIGLLPYLEKKTEPGPDITGFSIYEGTAYADPTIPAIATAETDFEQAYGALIQVLTDNVVTNPPSLSPIIVNDLNCTWNNSLDNGDSVTPGYYCLNAVDEGFNPIDVTLSGTIYLEGSGNFYFFIDPFSKGCQDDFGDPKMCDLGVESTVRFEYDRGASPDNVYWITTANVGGAFNPDPAVGESNVPTAADFSQVYVSSGAILDGTVLSGASIMFQDNAAVNTYTYGCGSIEAEPTGNRSTIFNGSLWLPYGCPTPVDDSFKKSAKADTGISILLAGSTAISTDLAVDDSSMLSEEVK